MARHPKEILFGDFVNYYSYPDGPAKKGLITDTGDDNHEIQINEIAKFPGEPEMMGTGGSSSPELIIFPVIRNRRLQTILGIARRSPAWENMSNESFLAYELRLRNVAQLRPRRILDI